MDRKTLNRVGLAAAILLVPGGLVLGAAVAAQRYRKRAAEAGEGEKAPVEIAEDDLA